MNKFNSLHLILDGIVSIRNFITANYRGACPVEYQKDCPTEVFLPNFSYLNNMTPESYPEKSLPT